MNLTKYFSKKVTNFYTTFLFYKFLKNYLCLISFNFSNFNMYTGNFLIKFSCRNNIIKFLSQLKNCLFFSKLYISSF